MHVDSSRNVYITYLVILTLLVITGCARNNTSRSTSRPKSLQERITLYTRAPFRGFVTIDLSQGTIRSIRPGGQMSYNVWNARLSEDDLMSFRKAIESSEQDLLTFKPDIKWFSGQMPPMDHGADLQLVLGNRESVFAMPSKEMRSKLPDDAKKSYEKIDAIATHLLDMEAKYRKSSHIKRVDQNSSAVRDLARDIEHVYRKSLPKGRAGW